jgi:hypothetical protein
MTVERHYALSRVSHSSLEEEPLEVQESRVRLEKENKGKG